MREATVLALNVSASVNYQSGSQTISGALSTENFSSGGDAGAIVLESDTNRVVGMLIAGSYRVTICIPIVTILRELEIRIPGIDATIEVIQEVALTDFVAINDTVGYRKRDRLGYETYIESFVRLIHDPETKPPLTIGIYGAWGSGKTFLMTCIMERLRDLGPTDE